MCSPVCATPPFAHSRLLGKHIWPVNMCARDSGIDYGCQISGLKALPACATPPSTSRGAQGSGICAAYWHSAPSTISPSPRTHTHATRGNPLPAIAWNPSRFINSHYCCHCWPHWIANVCVCVRGRRERGLCAHGGTTTMRPRKTKCFNALHASSSAYLSELRIYVCNRNSSFCAGLTGTEREVEREGKREGAALRSTDGFGCYLFALSTSRADVALRFIRQKHLHILLSANGASLAPATPTFTTPAYRAVSVCQCYQLFLVQPPVTKW